MKVPMPNRNRGAFIADDDVAMHVTPKIGERISMDISDELAMNFPKEAVAMALERLAFEAVMRNEHAINRAVDDLLRDEEWARPIIRDAIKKSVREIIGDMFVPIKDAHR